MGSEVQIKPYQRRSARIPRRFLVFVRWTTRHGNFWEELASTYLLSKHGGLLECSTRFKAGDDFFLWWPEREKEARARVVLRQLTEIDSVEVAFEFLDADDFWGIHIPPDPRF